MLKDSRKHLSKFHIYRQKSVLLKITFLHTVWSGYMGCFLLVWWCKKVINLAHFKDFEKQRKFKAQQFQSFSDDQVKCEDVLSDLFSH